MRIPVFAACMLVPASASAQTSGTVTKQNPGLVGDRFKPLT
jgi:hypothetical protein